MPKKKTKTINYIAIRRCFDFNRLWVPQREASQEKDYLLTVSEGTIVNEKNFTKVDNNSGKSKSVEKKKVALSQVKMNEFMD